MLVSRRSKSSRFLSGGLLKFLVYGVPIANEDVMLRQLIFDTIRNCPRIFERVRQSMIRCVQACVESNGRHFEHLL
ncbi:hypothetical protein ALC60_03242 [Trachymyrmex zeteki]|uniref:Myotubularin phosphatase domain-containing protein n=1 Tax=Mycetomoellerius zeteki TaxID=64791 RepID=A0A151XBN4_9HYME|nr:hypothetical protein ALC60_03242 [Trachymyrmex zeteki]